MESYSLPMPNEKIYTMMCYTCQPLAFKKKFDCLLTIDTDKFTINGSHKLQFLKAVNHLNYLCTLPIDEETYDQRPRETNQTENEYYRSWSNRQVREIYEKYRVVLIPRHAIRDILGRVEDQLRFYCLSTDTAKNKQFMKEYNAINILRQSQENTVRHPSVAKKIRIMLDFKVFVCLRLLNLPQIMNIDNLVCRGPAGLYCDSMPINLMDICQQYVLEEQTISLKQYLKIVNSSVFIGLVSHSKAKLIFQTDLINEANKYCHYRTVKEDKAYFIRHKDTPPLQEILINFNVKSEKSKKTLILEASDPMNMESKIKTQMLKYIPESQIESVIPKEGIISITYKSQLNINGRILEFMNRIKRVERIVVPAEVAQALDKTFYRSKMEKIANQQLFQWQLTKNDTRDETYFTFHGYDGQPYNVLKRISNFVRQISIITYTVQIQDIEAVRLQRLKKEVEEVMNKLSIKEVKVRVRDESIDIEGIVLQEVIHEETLKEIEGFFRKKGIEIFLTFYWHPYSEIELELEADVLSQSEIESSIQSSFSKSIELSMISEVRKKDGNISQQMSFLSDMIVRERVLNIPDVIFFGMDEELAKGLFKAETNYVLKAGSDRVAEFLDSMVKQLELSLVSSKFLRYLDSRNEAIEGYMRKNQFRVKVYSKTTQHKDFVDWKLRILQKLKNIDEVEVFQGYFLGDVQIKRSEVENQKKVTYGFFFQEPGNPNTIDHLKEYRVKAQ